MAKSTTQVATSSSTKGNKGVPLKSSEEQDATRRAAKASRRHGASTTTSARTPEPRGRRWDIQYGAVRRPAQTVQPVAAVANTNHPVQQSAAQQFRTKQQHAALASEEFVKLEKGSVTQLIARAMICAFNEVTTSRTPLAGERTLRAQDKVQSALAGEDIAEADLETGFRVARKALIAGYKAVKASSGN